MGAFGPGFGPNFDRGAATQGKTGGPGGRVVFERDEGRIVSRTTTAVGFRRATMLKRSLTVRLEASSSIPLQEVVPVRGSGSVASDRTIVVVGETERRLKSIRHAAMRRAARIVRSVKLLDIFYTGHRVRDKPEKRKPTKKEERKNEDDGDVAWERRQGWFPKEDDDN